MPERRMGDYCPTPTDTRLYHTAELHVGGASTSVAGIARDRTRFGSEENLRILEALVTPPLYFTFDETGLRATLHIEWHGLRFWRTAKIERLRQDLELFAPDMVSLFEEAYEQVRHAFTPRAVPVEVEGT